jgi:hypothetical protein
MSYSQRWFPVKKEEAVGILEAIAKFNFISTSQISYQYVAELIISETVDLKILISFGHM